MERSARRLPTQLLFGLLVVAVGIVLLAETTGLYDLRFLFDYWPSLFVLLGLYAMVQSGFRNLFGPGVVVVVAGVWQLVALDYVAADRVWQFWPVLVVLFGLSLVVGHFRSRPRGESAASPHVSAFAAFGGSQKRSNSTSFSGADLTAAFGGVELDLRDAEVSDPPAHVNAVALFGGVEIHAPREWNVELDVLPLFGGASDDRPRTEESERRDRRAGEEAVDLVVSGVAAFGGVEVN